MDGDGDLDLAVGNNGRNRLYRNEGGGIFIELPGALGFVTDHTRSVAWGDMDGDGDLDLAVGNYEGVNRLYRNTGGEVFLELTGLLGLATDWTGSVAWGDINADGDLDLTIVNGCGGPPSEVVCSPNRVYKNTRQGGKTLPDNVPYLNVTAPYTSTSAFYAAAIMLDSPTIPITYTLFDPEGGLVGQVDAFYSPDGGGRWLPAVATAGTMTQNLSLGAALAFDGVDDWVETADFDIENNFTLSLWLNPDITAMHNQNFIGKHTTAGENLILFGFWNGGYHVRIRNATFESGAKMGGWQHLAVVGQQVASNTTRVTVYRNGEVLWQHDFGAVVGDVGNGKPWTIGQDWDGNTQGDFFKGRMDEVRIWNSARSQTEIKANMYRRLNGDEPGLVAYWPFNEGTGDKVGDQTINGYSGILGGEIPGQKPRWIGGPFTTYTYTWDTLASGFFGQSDNVVFRIVVHPQPATAADTGTYSYLNSTPGPFQRPYASTTTFPFRVRGTQVRVFSETVASGNEAVGALVYRWNEDAGSTLLANSAGVPFRTDQHGYLQGRGQIDLGDQLLAMAPVSSVTKYAGVLTFNGLDDYAIKNPFNTAPITETTVSFWISTTQDTAGTPFSYAVSGQDNELLIFDVNNLVLYRGGVAASTGVTVTDGNWHHIAFTWRDADDRAVLYKDGKLAYSGILTATTIVPGGSLVLGQEQDNLGGGFQNTQAFEGMLDEVCVWNIALAESQILDELVGLHSDSHLVACWSFDNADTPGADASGNANDLTLYGATWDGDYLGGYTVYHTNGSPTATGVDAFPVTQAGVQTITVSAARPLILFDLNVSLEWDAHNDPVYLQQLEIDLKKASAYLYDFTNGQVALGKITVHQNADYWASAHIAVQASNRLRPFASIGGLPLNVFTETVTVDGQEHSLTYGPGQIRMGATWNRYGDPAASVGVDWPLILAHELSHYLLYQYDVYLGLNEDGLLVPEDACTGSAMGDVYTIDNTEFISDTLHWTTACSQTLAAKTLGRTEWETLRAWYPWLISPTLANAGPSQMPFQFTTVEIVAPTQAQDSIEDPTFYLDYAGGVVSSSEARAFLLRDADAVALPGPDDFEYIYDLGSPIGGQNRVLARGARPGDRLCVFDNTHAQFGCEVIAAGDERLTLKEDLTWTPVIQLSPVNSTTFALQVTGLASTTDSLKARIFPEFGTVFTPTTLAYADGTYTAALTLPYPVMSGHVQVWVDEPASESSPRREAMVNFNIGGNPGISRAGGIGISRAGGIGISRAVGIGISRAGGIGISRAGGIGGLQTGEAPLVSPDGQMILYLSDVITFAEGQFYTIQAMAGLPDPPPGRTLVGQGYNLVATGFLTESSAFTGSVSIQYLGSDVLVADANENNLDIYFWDGADWIMLDTTLNTYFNMASAPSQGTGIYALMASAKIRLYGPGWNLFAYPLPTTRPVAQALLSISGTYTTVYGYAADDPGDPWKVYDVTVPEWLRPVVNDLTALEFGKGYWINVSQAITLYLSNAAALPLSLEAIALASPPDTFYGRVLGNATFTPTAGMSVEAHLDGIMCGRDVTRAWEDEVVYVVDVDANDGILSNCGNPGDTVVFYVAGRPMAPTAVWDNMQLNELTLTLAFPVYLPLVLRAK